MGDFALSDVYALESSLGQLYPHNHHVRDKGYSSSSKFCAILVCLCLGRRRADWLEILTIIEQRRTMALDYGKQSRFYKHEECGTHWADLWSCRLQRRIPVPRRD